MATTNMIDTWLHPSTDKVMYVERHKNAVHTTVVNDGSEDVVFEGWKLAESKEDTPCGSYREFLEVYQSQGGSLICSRVIARNPCQRGSACTKEAMVVEHIKEIKGYFGMTRAAKALYKEAVFIEEPKRQVT